MKNFTLTLWLLVGAGVATLLFYKEYYTFLYITGYIVGWTANGIDKNGE